MGTVSHSTQEPYTHHNIYYYTFSNKVSLHHTLHRLGNPIKVPTFLDGCTVALAANSYTLPKNGIV